MTPSRLAISGAGRLALVLVPLLASACMEKYVHDPADVEPRTPAPLCPGDEPEEGDFCLPTHAVIEILQSGDFEVVGVEAAPNGVSRPAMLTLSSTYAGRPFVFRAKWKPAAASGDGLNNSPRHELAAYALQNLFLDPPDYVVPPTVGHCFPTKMYNEELGAGSPQFSGTDCVFGVLSYWLENVTDDAIWDAARYRHDPQYREVVSDLNVFTYLVDHGDTREGNLLVSSDPRDPRAFAVDNGMTFDTLLENITDNDWKELFVPDVSERTARRLRSIDPNEIVALGSAARFELHEGVLRPRRPRPPTLPPDDGVRWHPPVLEMGLHKRELNGVEERLAALVRRIDAGEVAVRR